MWVGIAIHPYAYFLVKSDQVIADFRPVLGPPDHHASPFVLGHEVEPQRGPAIPILPGPTAQAKLFISYEIVFHHFRVAILNLNAVATFFHLVIYYVAAVAEQSYYACRRALLDVVVLD